MTHAGAIVHDKIMLPLVRIGVVEFSFYRIDDKIVYRAIDTHRTKWPRMSQ